MNDYLIARDAALIPSARPVARRFRPRRRGSAPDAPREAALVRRSAPEQRLGQLLRSHLALAGGDEPRRCRRRRTAHWALSRRVRCGPSLLRAI